MAVKYKDHFSTKNAKQGQKLPGSNQIENSDGAFVWGVDIWKRLDRFLILGSEGGSYYASERKLTIENAENVVKCVKEDGVRAVRRIAEVSYNGLAPKNDPALLALAIAAKMGDDATRREAYKALPAVARIPTHLFHFVAYAKELGGWGRGMRTAVANWYDCKGDNSKLAYHLIKYQSRDGWSNRDLLRLSHAAPSSSVQGALFHWVTKGNLEVEYSAKSERDEQAIQTVTAFEQLKAVASPKQAAEMIKKFRLPREAVPTNHLNEAVVWEALLESMPLEAMVRNLGNMSKVGLVKPFSAASKQIISRLGDKGAIKRARLHPLQLLVALNTYSSGHGVKGKGEWTVDPHINDGLEEAFYLAFDTIESTGKNHLLCIDTSGSMTWNDIAGMQGINPRIGSAVMAMVTAKTEKNSLFVSFSEQASEMDITGKWNLKSVIERVGKYPAVGTNCAAPIELAIKRGYDIDTIVIYTDNETNIMGARQPVVALRDLRQKLGHDVKFVVVGMVSNGFTVADPNDASMMDVVGFSSSAPQIISNFSSGAF